MSSSRNTNCPRDTASDEVSNEIDVLCHWCKAMLFHSGESFRCVLAHFNSFLESLFPIFLKGQSNFIESDLSACCLSCHQMERISCGRDNQLHMLESGVILWEFLVLVFFVKLVFVFIEQCR